MSSGVEFISLLLYLHKNPFDVYNSIDRIPHIYASLEVACHRYPIRYVHFRTGGSLPQLY